MNAVGGGGDDATTHILLLITKFPGIAFLIGMSGIFVLVIFTLYAMSLRNDTPPLTSTLDLRPGMATAKLKHKKQERVEGMVKINKWAPLNIGMTATFALLVLATAKAVRNETKAMTVCTVLCCFLIWFVKYTAGMFGQWWSGVVLRKLGDPLGKPVQAQKFQDQAWQFVVHMVMTAWAMSVLVENRDPDTNWWTHIEHTFIPAPMQQNHSPLLRHYYLTQLAVWVVTCFSHVAWEQAHKDYYVMYTHHLATIFLVCSSYCSGALRVGMVILLLHDASDISVDLLKLANYCKMEGPRGLFIVETTFVTNLCTWVYFRLYYFPFVVIHSLCTDVVRLVCPDGYPWNATDPGCNGLVLNNGGIWAVWPGVCCLFILMILHLYWFFLFLRIFYKLVSGEEGHDAGRTVYEGASDYDSADESRKKRN
jgi:hypothetical protein